MSKSASCPFDILVDNYVIIGRKELDGRFMPVTESLDTDLSKDNLLIYESSKSDITSLLLKYEDRYNNYFWNTSGSYFLGDSLL